MIKKILAAIEEKRFSESPLWAAVALAKDSCWKMLNPGKSVFTFVKTSFIVCNRKKFLFADIAKNASTTLKYLALKEDKIKCPPSQKVHYGKAIKRKAITIEQSKEEKFKEYLKFAVYRDPVERFLSTYENKIRHRKEKILAHFMKANLENASLDDFIKFAGAELRNKNHYRIDQHLMPQCFYYKPEAVDYIVPLNKLNQFLKEKLGINSVIEINKMGEKIKPSAKQAELIKKLYRKDYGIKTNY